MKENKQEDSTHLGTLGTTAIKVWLVLSGLQACKKYWPIGYGHCPAPNYHANSQDLCQSLKLHTTLSNWVVKCLTTMVMCTFVSGFRKKQQHNVVYLEQLMYS